MTGFYCHFSEHVNPNCPLSLLHVRLPLDQTGQEKVNIQSEGEDSLKFAPTGSEQDSTVLQAQDSAQAQLMQAARRELKRGSIPFYKVVSYPSGFSAEHVTGRWNNHEFYSVQNCWELGPF